MTSTGPIRLATRSSDLARTQAGSVRDALERRRRTVELVTVETTGDRVRDELLHRLGKTGAFVRSLDERVLDGEVDAAVHSMKDVPTESPDELVLATVPERAPAGDVLVTPDGRSLEELPEGATVGTSSLRRRAQILRERPDLTVEPLRGNVDTRVEKLLAPSLQAEHERRREAAESEGNDGDHGNGGKHGNDGDDESASSNDEPGTTDAGSSASVEEWVDGLADHERAALDRDVETEYDAVVLAAAGLERSGLLDSVAAEPLPAERFVPAPGQGALAVSAQRDADVVSTLRTALEHRPTRIATTAERTILAELGGGCVAPLGVHATLQGRYVHVAVQALSRDGSECVEATRDLPVEDYVAAARSFAREVGERGATDLVERAKRDVEPGDDPDAGAASATGEGASGDEEDSTEEGTS